MDVAKDLPVPSPDPRSDIANLDTSIADINASRGAAIAREPVAEKTPAAPRPGYDLLVDLPTMRVSWPVTYIKTEAGLKKLAERLGKETLVSIDTETGGEKGESIDTRLAIIQFGINKYDEKGEIDPARGETFLIDVLALREAADRKTLKNNDGTIVNPLAPLKEFLEGTKNSGGEDLTKLVHFSQFERGQFRKYGIELNGVVDTQRLAKVLRPELKSTALAACCVEFLEMTMSKDEQTSDWLRRPLSQDQIDYAALDAQVLFTLYKELRQIERSNRIDSARTVSELAQDLKTALVDSLEAVRPSGLGNEYWQSMLRGKRIEDALKATLNRLIPEGKDEFRPEEPFIYGSAAITRRDDKKIDVKKFEAKFPDIAKELAEEYTSTKKAVEAALRSHGTRGADLKAALTEIFSKSVWNNPKLETGFNFGEYYGTTNASIEKAMAVGTLSDPKLTSERISAVREAALKVRPDLLDNSLEACAREILDIDIRMPDGKPTKAALKKHGAKVSEALSALEDKIAAIQANVDSPISGEPDQLLRELVVEAGKRYALLRGKEAGQKYGPALYRANRAAGVLTEKLAPGLGEERSSYSEETPSGTMAVSRGSRAAIDLDIFRTRYADVASEVLCPPKKEIEEALKKRNIDAATRAASFKEIEEVLGRTSPEFKCHPKIKLLYVPGGGHDKNDESETEESAVA